MDSPSRKPWDLVFNKSPGEPDVPKDWRTTDVGVAGS